MTFMRGVNLLPATGEWTYDTRPHRGTRVDEAAATILNTYAAPGGVQTDYTIALDQLQAQFPDCTTVALIVAWFGDSTDAATCKIYPSTNYIGGRFDALVDGAWQPTTWRCSGLTQSSSGLIPISSSGGANTYGGTPSDDALVRCILDLKTRGLRVVFYPFLLMDCAGLPWRGRIGISAGDVTASATATVTTFLGAARPQDFTRDATNLTVAYAGAADDYTFRRMILHYANLCVVAGGVDLFLLGSELRGLEIVRGPQWTKAGTLDANGAAAWDYPFVAGLVQLADDVRGIFNAAGFSRDSSALKNLVTYAPDWSSWMGYQHPGENGQWPHLDALHAHANVDIVAFDNYLPLSDWTSGDGGLDALFWEAPRPTSWPPAAGALNGLGLTGTPELRNAAYLKANIEGGEKYDWFYADSTNAGAGADPAGSALVVSRPNGDRLTQTRSPYAPGQELLANKMLRWWWHNPHQAIYDAGDGQGFAPHGPATGWIPCGKSIAFTEYGIPSCDRGTNQPNVFYDPKSTESFTAFWSIWDPAFGGGVTPRRDGDLQILSLQAIYEYWFEDGFNETSAAGLPMVEAAFSSVWNWDARPFPTFPARNDVWGDAGNWRAGQWLNGKAPTFVLPQPDAVPAAATLPLFPTLLGQSAAVKLRPRFAGANTTHVSGRGARLLRASQPLWDVEIAFDVLRLSPSAPDVQTLLAFFDACRGCDASFLVASPLGAATDQALGIGNGVQTAFPLHRTIGGIVVPVSAVAGAPSVRVDGALMPGDAFVSQAGPPVQIVFAVAPAPGAVLTACFADLLVCRFADDQQSLEAFAANLFSTGTIVLQGVRA